MTYLIIFSLILLSALFSGLTIGLLGLDQTELQRKSKLGEKKAVKILSVRKNGNFLLVTLLLGNVLVNSILSVYLGSTFTGLWAVLISTALIVVFGEIVPQAVFYRHALKFGPYFVPIVKFFQFLLFPIAYPIGKILDKILGTEEETVWSKKELKEIIKHHEDSEKSQVDEDEENIVLGALSFSDKKVNQVMTPKRAVFSVKVDDVLNYKLLEKIEKKGFSRIPVFGESEDEILGVLNVKKLISAKQDSLVSNLYYKNRIFYVNENDKLDDVLNKFIQKKIHLAAVFNTHKTFLGIVTMEDVMEEILAKEIVDETDLHVDMRRVEKNV
ncbi:hypothetical protein CSB11_01690 [Candidatus Campbellbacteria bacterium]|nr:MAG: hypothetical protein CSB11_01690 [Candidatus Campbellbacteria bacterium]